MRDMGVGEDLTVVVEEVVMGDGVNLVPLWSINLLWDYQDRLSCWLQRFHWLCQTLWKWRVRHRLVDHWKWVLQNL